MATGKALGSGCPVRGIARGRAAACGLQPPRGRRQPDESGAWMPPKRRRTGTTEGAASHSVREFVLMRLLCTSSAATRRQQRPPMQRQPAQQPGSAVWSSATRAPHAMALGALLLLLGRLAPPHLTTLADPRSERRAGRGTGPRGGGLRGCRPGLAGAGSTSRPDRSSRRRPPGTTGAKVKQARADSDDAAGGCLASGDVLGLRPGVTAAPNRPD